MPFLRQNVARISQLLFELFDVCCHDVSFFASVTAPELPCES
jgi:hypothetical protein